MSPVTHYPEHPRTHAPSKTLRSLAAAARMLCGNLFWNMQMRTTRACKKDACTFSQHTHMYTHIHTHTRADTYTHGTPAHHLCADMKRVRELRWHSLGWYMRDLDPFCVCSFSCFLRRHRFRKHCDHCMRSALAWCAVVHVFSKYSRWSVLNYIANRTCWNTSSDTW